MPKQIPKIGDVFLVPLSDGRKCLGQVLEIEPVLMNSITCAFFIPPLVDEKADPSPLICPEKALSCQFVTRDMFNKGIWERIGNFPVTIPEPLLPHRDKRALKWVGATVFGSGILNQLMNAYFGLADWRGMKDQDYYQKLLLPGRTGPQSQINANQPSVS